MTPEQRQFILSLDRDGDIRPDDVLAAGEPEDSPIHDMFTWDNEVAGHRHRMREARQLIQRVHIVEIKSEPITHQIKVAEYVHDALLPQGEQGYTRLGVVKTREESAIATIQAELDRVASMVKRGRMIAQRLDLVAEFEAGLRALIGTRDAGEATKTPRRRKAG